MSEKLAFSEAARCLAELGHPHRLQLFNLLVKVGAAGSTVSEVQQALAVPKSTLSHHLAQLMSVGLVTQTREGRALRCRVEPRRADLVRQFINECCDGLPSASGDV